jgi:hypothetical protein
MSDGLLTDTNYKVCIITCCMFTDNKEEGHGNLQSRRPILKKKFNDYDFFLFTNQQNLSHTSDWDVIYVSNDYLDNECKMNECSDVREDVYRSRYHKWQGYKYLRDVMKKNYDVIFYCDIDINIEKITNWDEMIHNTFKNGLTHRNHKDINRSAYIECDKMRYKDNVENCDNMKNYLEDNKMPIKCINTENYFFGYNPNNNKIVNALDDFFNIYIEEKITHRDQPLWWYILWKHDIKPNIIEFTR